MNYIIENPNKMKIIFIFAKKIIIIKIEVDSFEVYNSNCIRFKI